MARGTFLIGAALALATGLAVGRFLPVSNKIHSAKPSSKVELIDGQPKSVDLSDSILAGESEWLSKIESGDADSMAKLVLDTESITLSALRTEMQKLALKKWLSLDPQSVLGWGQSEEGEKYFDLFFGEWALLDFDAAITQADALGNDDKIREAYQAMSRALARHGDPADFLLWANEMDQKKIPQGLYQVAISRLAREDLETAKSVALTIRRNPANMNSLRHVADVWSETDPRAALAWANSIEQRDFSDQAVGLVLKKLVSVDSDLAGQEFSKIRNPRMKLESLGNKIVSELAGEDPISAVEWATKYLPEKSRNKAYHSVIRKALEAGPIETLNAMETMPEEVLTKLSLQGWLPGNQLEQLQMLDSEGAQSVAKENLQQALLKNLARSDFETAWDYANNASGEKRDSLMEAIFQSPGDVSLALEKLGLSGYSKENELSLRNRLGSTLSYKDPASALDMFLAMPAQEEGATHNNATLRNLIVSGKLRTVGVEKSIQWAEALSDPGLQRQAYSVIASEWFTNDPFGLSEWASALPAGIAKEEAAWDLSSKLSRFDPEASFHWAMEVSDPNRRAPLLRSSVMNWLKQNPEATRKAIDNNRLLSGPERTELLKQVENSTQR